MSRYIRTEVLNQPGDFVSFMMNEFIKNNHFTPASYQGQMVLQAGLGWFDLPKYMIWSYVNGVFHIETWTRNAIIPGIWYGKENDFSGYYGALPKSIYKGTVDSLINSLHQPLPSQPMQPVFNQPNPQMGQGYNQPNPQAMGQGYNQPNPQNMAQGYGQPVAQAMAQSYQQPILVNGLDYKREAMLCFGMGLAGFFLCWVRIAFIFSITSFVYFGRGMKSSRKGFAVTGLVFGILGLCAYALLVVLSIIGALVS